MITLRHRHVSNLIRVTLSKSSKEAVFKREEELTDRGAGSTLVPSPLQGVVSGEPGSAAQMGEGWRATGWERLLKAGLVREVCPSIGDEMNKLSSILAAKY